MESDSSTLQDKIRQTTVKTDDTKVDEELYSRQLYVIGYDAMKKMMNTRILLLGLDGLGQEIAKNICLAGIKSLTLFDKSLVTESCLLSGFYHKRCYLNQQKDISVLDAFKSLNKYVKVNVADVIDYSEYDVVISVNKNIIENIKINDICHSKKIKFIMANISGLFSQIFCDFQSHICIDKNGEPISMGVINDISQTGILTVADGSSHSLEDGDTIKISHLKEFFKVKVLNRLQIELIGYKNQEIFIGGDFEQVKIPFVIEFSSLAASLKNPEIMSMDFSNERKNLIMHNLFVHNASGEEEYKELEAQFMNTKNCLIPPMCSIVGGFAAQEAIKAASGKFMPIKQFYYFDSADSYLGDYSKESDNIVSRYSDMVRLFGSEGFKKIKQTKVFLVGAGAIGCENLKNFVCCGMGSEGKIIVTDMDSIEKSNLNRQFLFKEDDVSKMKSESAVKHVADLNEDFMASYQSLNEEVKDDDSECLNNGIQEIDIKRSSNLEYYTIAVRKETENIFTDKFIRDLDIVSNALDNVEARAYMDERCIKSRKPMVDAGTLGTKGHVQVVIPFLSESYSSSVDPQEKSIPLCTIKSYPYSIDHTIEWALSEFKTHFNENVLKLQEYMDMDKPCEDQELLEIYNQAPKTIEGCLKKALSLFVNNYSTSIQGLLATFPPDHKDKEGNAFWIPPKKIPSPLSFNMNDQLHIIFVETAANLFAKAHNIRKITIDEVYAFLENIYSLQEPTPIKFGGADSDFKNLYPIEYDKDSWHSDFIFACANLRARNYNIKERSKHHIKGIAGKIIPAIATTTAIVSGLATLEILKYVTKRNSKLDNSSTAEGFILNSKNSFLDLAFPFLASTDLVKPQSMFYEYNNKKVKYTIWSRMEFPDMELAELIRKIEEKVGTPIGMVSIGPKVVFWNISDKYEINQKKKISELCNKRDGQLLVYVDVIPDDDSDIMNVAVMFDD